MAISFLPAAPFNWMALKSGLSGFMSSCNIPFSLNPMGQETMILPSCSMTDAPFSEEKSARFTFYWVKQVWLKANTSMLNSRYFSELMG
jgi:hypothetical protein